MTPVESWLLVGVVLAPVLAIGAVLVWRARYVPRDEVDLLAAVARQRARERHPGAGVSRPVPVPAAAFCMVQAAGTPLRRSYGAGDTGGWPEATDALLELWEGEQSVPEPAGQPPQGADA